jgi:hypothetical protein
MPKALPIDKKNNLPYIDVGGHRRYLAALPYPDFKKKSFPRYKDRFQSVPVSDWKDYSIEAWVVGIKDQDGQGSCVGHGSTGALEVARNISGFGATVLSAECCYGQINGGSDNGASVPDALTALRDVGTTTEASIGPLHWQPRGWPSGWKDEAARFKIENGFEINTFEDSVSCVLSTNSPVCIGIDCGRNFNPDNQGVLPDQSGSGGGHCLYMVGVKKFGSVWKARIVNSWGMWGDHGMCWMPRSYFDNTNGGHWGIIAAQSDPQDPNKPPVTKARRKSK